MKTIQLNNEGNEIINIHLRSITMNATRLTMIVFSAVAILISGCSKNNRVMGPETDPYSDLNQDQAELIAPAENQHNAANIAGGNGENGPEYLSIIAEVLRTEVEGGCWYLRSENGDNYTPLVPQGLTLQLGMKLKAIGYIDKNIHFFCGYGPAFVIEQYHLLNGSKSPDQERPPKNQSSQNISDMATEDRAPQPSATIIEKKKLFEEGLLLAPSEVRAPAEPTEDVAPLAPGEDRAPRKYEAGKAAIEAPTVMGKPVPIIYGDMELRPGQAGNAFEGYIHHSKEGCLLFETAQKDIFELQHDMDVVLKEGVYIRATGYISTLPIFTCSDAPVFRAETIKILWYPKDPEQPAISTDVPSEDAFNPALIEAEGTMHPTVPEGMCWYFETDSGERYELILSNPVSFRSGMRLKITANPTQVPTFCQSGKPVKVIRWEKVDEDKF